MDLDKLVSSDPSVLLMQIRDSIDSHLSLSIASQQENAGALAMKLEVLLQVYSQKAKEADIESRHVVSTHNDIVLNNLSSVVARLEAELKEIQASMASSSSLQREVLTQQRVNHSDPAAELGVRSTERREEGSHDEKESAPPLRIKKLEPRQREESVSPAHSKSQVAQPQEHTSAPHSRLADTFAKPTVRNEAVSITKGADTATRLSAISSIKKGMTINDRRLFRMELCEGDEENFREMIDAIDHSSALEDAITVLHKYYHGDADNLVLQQFIELLERRFVNG